MSLCCPTYVRTQGNNFRPLHYSDYTIAKKADALLWIVAIIGLLGLTEVISMGSTASYCLIGCGGGPAFILTLYLIRDRHKSYIVNVDCQTYTHDMTVTASKKVGCLRTVLSHSPNSQLFLNGQALDEDKTFGEQDILSSEVNLVYQRPQS